MTVTVLPTFRYDGSRRVDFVFGIDDDAYAELLWFPAPFSSWVLHQIHVPPFQRGRGLGRALLDAVLDYADSRGEPVMLGPAPSADCPIDVEAWYARHGFTWTRSGAMMERPVPA